jgi:hypothetical protein
MVRDYYGAPRTRWHFPQSLFLYKEYLLVLKAKPLFLAGHFCLLCFDEMGAMLDGTKTGS